MFTRRWAGRHPLITVGPTATPNVARVIRLSVVVPFSNVASYAAEAVQSLVRNAADDIEFILVDDASTDDTPAILAHGIDRLPGATLITLEKNSGVSTARNVGLAAARGRYLTFVDGDDVVAPGHHTQLVDTIEALGCDFVRTDHVQVRGRQRIVHRICHAPRAVVCPPRTGIGRPAWRSSVDAAYSWAGVYDRALLDSGLLLFDEDLRTCEDRPWIWRLHMHAASFAVVGLHGVRYRRQVATSLTQIGDVRQFDFIPAFERLIAEVQAVDDVQAPQHLNKALRTYCAVTCHHLNETDRYTPELAAELHRRAAVSFRGLPWNRLAAVIADLDPARAGVIEALASAA